MAFNSDCSTAIVSKFQGATPSQDVYEIDPAHGLYSQNVDYFQGLNQSVQVSTRRGTSLVTAFPPGQGQVLSLKNWYYNLGGVEDSLAVFYAPDLGVRAWSQLHQAFIGNLGTKTGASSAVHVLDGVRLYSAYVDASGRNGVGGTEVVTTPGSGSGTPDPVFPPGLSGLSTATVSVAQATVSGGNITLGIHNIVVFVTTANGYFGPINANIPADIAIVGTAFFFSGIIVVSPNNTIRISIQIPGPYPSWLVGATLQFAMTTATNQARYFLVPGLTTAIPSPGVNTLVATISLSDNDLVLGTDVTQKQNYFGSAQSPNPPFLPSALFQYSSRLGYIAKDSAGFPVVYFSDQNAYQSASPAFHGIYIEGRQIPVQGASLGGICYIGTLSGLYATQDNGDLPATWNPPSHIDGSVGILSPTCILAAGGKILLASEKGLYLFRGGSFPQLPISYFQSHDWNRINWNAPTQVQIVDDPYDKVIRVLAPLNVVVTGASIGANITITTAVLVNGVPLPLPHLFSPGMTVQIANVPGNTQANGTWVVTTVPSPNTFTIARLGVTPYIPSPQGWAGTVTPQTPNAIMTWAYPGGDQIYELFYSLHGFTSFLPGAMSTIRNLSTGVDETWWAPESTFVPGILLRRVLPTDSLIYRDADYLGGAQPISSLYQTSLLPGSQDESITVHDFHGAHFRVSGLGPLNLFVASLDNAVNLVPVASPLSLSQSPGLEYLVKWFLRSEQETIQFGTNSLDSYFVMALIRCYYTNALPQR